MMTNSTNLEKKLEGTNNLLEWKYRVLLIPEESRPEDNYDKEEDADPKGDEYKA